MVGYIWEHVDIDTGMSVRLVLENQGILSVGTHIDTLVGSSLAL